MLMPEFETSCWFQSTQQYWADMPHLHDIFLWAVPHIQCGHAHVFGMVNSMLRQQEVQSSQTCNPVMDHAWCLYSVWCISIAVVRTPWWCKCFANCSQHVTAVDYTQAEVVFLRLMFQFQTPLLSICKHLWCMKSGRPHSTNWLLQSKTGNHWH